MHLKGSEGMHPQVLMSTEGEVKLEPFINYPYQLETLARLLYYYALFIIVFCTVHVIRSLNCQYQHMHNFNVTG